MPPLPVRLLVCVAFALVACGRCEAAVPVDAVARLVAPPGFSVSVFSDRVPSARAMALSPGGTLYVGSRDPGRVYALRDEDADGRAERVVVVADGLDQPVGLDLRRGSLYVAAMSRILRFDDIDAKLGAPPKPVVVTDQLPTDEHHGWKFIRFGPDDRLYVPVGAPCNVCVRPDPY